MEHLTEEQLIAHAYAEAPPEAAEHLRACGECGRAFADLRSDLNDMQQVVPPHRDDFYGEQMWQRIAPEIAQVKPGRRWFQLELVPTLSYAALCAALVVGAFVAGRWFEGRNKKEIAVYHAPAPQAKQPIVVVVLGDHLDRTERLLVELKHVDGDNTELMPPLRDEARSLLAANRIARGDAEKTGNPELSSALDRLDHVLNELANQPGGLNAEAVARLQDELDTDGLLFEVRVLRSREHNKTSASHTNGGEI